MPCCPPGKLDSYICKQEKSRTDVVESLLLDEWSRREETKPGTHNIASSIQLHCTAHYGQIRIQPLLFDTNGFPMDSFICY